MSQAKPHGRRTQSHLLRDAPRQTTIFLFVVHKGCIFRCQTGWVAYVRICLIFVQAGGNTLAPFARDTPRMHLLLLCVQSDCFLQDVSNGISKIMERACVFATCLRRNLTRGTRRGFFNGTPRAKPPYSYLWCVGGAYSGQTGWVAYVRIFFQLYLFTGANILAPLARDTPRMHLPRLCVRCKCVFLEDVPSGISKIMERTSVLTICLRRNLTGGARRVIY